MYFKSTTLLEETEKEDFKNINNYFEIQRWAKSSVPGEIRKALAYTERALKHFQSGTKNELINNSEYTSILSNFICKNENLDSDTLSYIYKVVCKGINSNLSSDIKGTVSSIAANPSASHETKLDILDNYQYFSNDEYILGQVAKNKANTPDFIEDLFYNHQGNYVEFRTGMGCSWFNENIAANPNTPENVMMSMINELPEAIKAKSEEHDNMSNHPHYFNSIYKAIAKNPNISEGILEILFDKREHFSQKMDYTYYVAKNTKSPELLDKIVKERNSYSGIYQAVLQNKNMATKTIDSILDNETSIPDSEKSRLIFAQQLNSEQLNKACAYLGNHGLSNVKEILAFDSCDISVCETLLKNYSSSTQEDIRKTIQEHLDGLKIDSEPSVELSVASFANESGHSQIARSF